MSYNTLSLFQLLDDIQKGKLVLPHIQRSFVWEEDQMVRLFDSLMRNYPIQTFLFWKTKEAIKTRKFMDIVDRDVDLSALYDENKSVAEVEKIFVLDGQQRLQTLYAIYRGALVNENGEKAEAYIDLTTGENPINGGDLYYRLEFSTTPKRLPHYRVRDLTERHEKKGSNKIANEINEALDKELQETSENRKKRENAVRDNIDRMTQILRQAGHFYVDELDGIANADIYTYRAILDIFVRVNSGGTKLTAADLMFAAMKEGWADIEENIEQTVELLNNGGRLAFDKDFPLKCLLLVADGDAEIQQSKFAGAKGKELLQKMEANWERAEVAFIELRDFIVKDLRLFSDKIIRSYNAFIPLFSYLYYNSKPNEATRTLMRAYYHKAQLFNWYANQTTITLNSLHAILGKAIPSGFDLTGVKAYFKDKRNDIVELQDSHLSDNRLRSIILGTVYAEKWGASPFDVMFKGNDPHVDHIYPQYMLRSKLGQATREINDIGNLRYFGASDNIRKKAQLPGSYFAGLKKSNVDIEKHLLLKEYADDPSKLEFTVEAFTAFRTKRRAEIWKLAKKVVDPEVTN